MRQDYINVQKRNRYLDPSGTPSPLSAGIAEKSHKGRPTLIYFNQKLNCVDCFLLRLNVVKS